MEILCDKNKYFELKLLDLMCYGNENDCMQQCVYVWMMCLLGEVDMYVLLYVVQDGLCEIFDVLVVVLCVWQVGEEFVYLEVVQGVSEEVCLFVVGLCVLYCGVNVGFEVVGWLDMLDIGELIELFVIVMLCVLVWGDVDVSVVLVFGLLVFGLLDGCCFYDGMGMIYFVQIGELVVVMFNCLCD